MVGQLIVHIDVTFCVSTVGIGIGTNKAEIDKLRVGGLTLMGKGQPIYHYREMTV